MFSSTKPNRPLSMLAVDDNNTISSASTFVAELSPGPSDTDSLFEYAEKRPMSDNVLDAERRRSGIRQIWSYLSLILFYLAKILPRSGRPAHNKKTSELHSTAYLDAIRAYAAWVVYNSHVIHEDWRPESSSLMHFPCFKIIFRGHAQVDVFFVISGYALSYSMLKSMHTKQPNRVLDSLASSTFRRYMRLFLPTAVATFVTMIALSLRLATKGEGPEVLQESFVANLAFWIADTVQASDPFAHVDGWWSGGSHGSKYLPQMWTIAIEFRGSMILFMFCAAVCKMAPRTRMAITWASIIACFWWQAQYVGLFLAGMWIADLRLWKGTKQVGDLGLLGSSSPTPQPSKNQLDAEKNLPGQTPAVTPTSSTIRSLIRQSPYIFLGIFSLNFLTAPLLISKGSPFPNNLIFHIMPPKYHAGAHVHFPLAIGAIMLIYAIDNSPILQKPFMLPFSQFVGELSFGIYAMHNTIRWIVWEKAFVKWQFEYWGPDAKGFWNFLPGYLVMTVIVFWAAEWFRRVDVKVVKLGKVMQEWCWES